MVDKRVGVRGMSEEWEWEIEKGEINRLILIKPHKVNGVKRFEYYSPFYFINLVWYQCFLYPGCPKNCKQW